MNEDYYRSLYEGAFLQLQEAERYILYLQDSVEAASTGINKEGYSVEQQLLAIKRHAANRGLYKIQHEHLDK